jgi:hypothetical protein
MLKALLFCNLLLTSSMLYAQFVSTTDSPVTSDGADSSGASWADFDNDKDDDLFVTVTNNGGLSSKDILYRNNGDGTFTKVVTNDLVNTDGTGRNSTWADYDNDGLIDVFITNQLEKFLYRNNGGGTFTRIQALPTSELSFAGGDFSGGAWGDYNQDGFVDLYVSAYRVGNSGRNILYTNNKNGTFTEANDAHALSVAAPAFDPSWIDFDGNGTLDVFVPVYFGNNFLFSNEGNGTFTNVTGPITNYNHAIGASWADFDNDGDFDVLVQDNVNQNDQLFSNNGNGTFTEISTAATAMSSTSSAWADFDNDGWIDIIHVGSGPDGNTLLFRNNGDKTFSNVTAENGITNKNYSRSVAVSDYNKDGFLDFFIANSFGNDLPVDDILYTNTPNENGWISIWLTGTNSNRSALGAVVKVKSAVGKQIRTVQSKTGYNAQNSIGVHFGIGTSTKVDTIQVFWPGKGYQELVDQSKNQFLEISEINFPESPSALAVENKKYGEAYLTWTDNSGLETGFRLERSTNNVNFFPIASIDANKIDFTDKNVLEGKTYYYRLASTTTEGFSLYSNTISVFIKKKQQVIFQPISEKALDSPPFHLMATSNSPLPINFKILDGAENVSLQGNTLSIEGLGPSTIGAYQTGDDNYFASDTAKQELNVTLITSTELSADQPWFAPNPAHHSIRLFNEHGNIAYTIYTIHGQRIQQGQAKNNETISIRSISPGLYLLQIGRQTFRLIKE